MATKTKPYFGSLAAERTYYAQEANKFMGQLQGQVTDIQTQAEQTAKKSLAWGGAYLLCFGVARALFGTHKHKLDGPEGPVTIKEKESVLVSAAKGAALLGLGVAAAQAARHYLAARSASTHAQDPRLEPDSTEL